MSSLVEHLAAKRAGALERAAPSDIHGTWPAELLAPEARWWLAAISDELEATDSPAHPGNGLAADWLRAQV